MKNQHLSVLKAILLREMEGGLCNECGGTMYEGMCTECGYMEEKVSFTDKYDNNPKLKGKQKDLPDKLQAQIVKKEGHEGTDHEVSMANNSLRSIVSNASQLIDKIGQDEKNIPAWIQDHIAKAENYIEQANNNYHEYKAPEEAMSVSAMIDNKLDEMIKKAGKKYNVYSKKGKKLGSHPSKKQAQKQLAAIEISKQGK